MARLRVAVIPSIQDTNRFSDPVTGQETNEMVQMHRLANQLLVVNGQTSGTSGIWMQRFTGRAYSQGDWRANLREQQRAAYAWLEGSPEPTVALNLHSDGVGWTHVGYYWCEAPESKALGKALATPLMPIFGTAKLMNADYSDYIFAIEMHQKHRAVLLEIGDHLVKADNKVIAEEGEQIAASIVKTLVEWFKLPIADEWTGVGDGLAKYGRAHPELGVPNRKALDWHYWDKDHDEVVKLTTGAWLVWRAYTGQPRHIDWREGEK